MPRTLKQRKQLYIGKPPVIEAPPKEASLDFEKESCYTLLAVMTNNTVPRAKFDMIWELKDFRESMIEALHLRISEQCSRDIEKLQVGA